MRPFILAFALLLPSLLTVASQADPCSALENPPRAYAYSYPFGDDESTGAYLGVDITDITPERISALKLKGEQGVEVTMVDQDAPAGKAGVKEHDVILTMNGTAVESGAQLRRLIRETPPGRVVSFGISRDGHPLTIKVQLGDRRKNYAYNYRGKDFHVEIPPIPPMPDIDISMSVVVVHSSLRSGLMVENITPQLGDFFGVKNGKGVLVRSVEKGSRAEKAGFRAGDVIVKVNDQAVQDTSDFSHALRSRSGSAAFVVVRDKHEQTLSMPLPERKDSGALLEESLDLPQIDAESEVELNAVRNEVAQLQPKIQLAMRQAQEAVEKARPEIERAQREARKDYQRYKSEVEHATAEARQAAEEAQREFLDHQKEWQERIQKSQRQMRDQWRDKSREWREQNRKQMERMRHEFAGDWLEI